MGKSIITLIKGEFPSTLGCNYRLLNITILF